VHKRGPGRSRPFGTPVAASRPVFRGGVRAAVARGLGQTSEGMRGGMMERENGRSLLSSCPSEPPTSPDLRDLADGAATSFWTRAVLFFFFYLDAKKLIWGNRNPFQEAYFSSLAFLQVAGLNCGCRSHTHTHTHSHTHTHTRTDTLIQKLTHTHAHTQLYLFLNEGISSW